MISADLPAGTAATHSSLKTPSISGKFTLHGGYTLPQTVPLLRGKDDPLMVVHPTGA